MERYESVLFNLALRTVGNRDEALDVTQTSFTRAFERLGDFDPRHRFFSWMYRITLNEALNVLRRRKTQTEVPETLPWHGDSPEDDVQQRELRERIGAALLRLSLDYRVVVILRHFLDLSYRDMAEILDIEEKTVKSRLFAARRRLAALLLPSKGEMA